MDDKETTTYSKFNHLSDDKLDEIIESNKSWRARFTTPLRHASNKARLACLKDANETLDFWIGLKSWRKAGGINICTT
jgi:hypothetical protein